ncbi:MAG TPA: hypothetical protein VNZ44_11845, partial [Pyrinomonadaceae bacterium]|nr:hypothetical protein [Pyrinomonadaceae bacterium]
TTRYDIAGNAVSTTDARGNTSTVSYSDSFSDGMSRNTYAFATSTASAVPDPSGVYGSTTALTPSTVYDFSTGLVTSTTDANNQTTSRSYADDAGHVDPLDRLMKVSLPDGGRAKYDYGQNQWGNYVHTRVLQDASGRETNSYDYTDGLGRPYRSFLYEGQDAAKPWLTTDTEYDSLGRVSRASAPYRSTGSAQAMFSGGRWSETAFDALSRVTAVTTRPDGAAVTSVYSGNAVTVTDQAGRKRSRASDALGRLTQVTEDPDGLHYVTAYAYDVLGNLRRVEQGGQQRFFMYDSLGRLIRAKNPEQSANGGLTLTDPLTGNSQWSTAYGYDANGNLATRVDARGVTATYTYDALNRTTTVRYSDGTKDVDRHYDGATNGRGRFWYFNWDPANNARFDTHLAVDEYDAAGRTIKYRQHFLTNGVASQPFLLTVAYNLMGAVTSETYPSGHTVVYSYDAAGRPSGFTGSLGDGAARTYSSEVLYDEMGGMSQERFGTDTPVYHKLLYNSRGQLAEIRVGLYPLTDPDPDRRTSWQRGAIINH